MPHPGDIHHCNKCGSKGAAKTAAAAGRCEHRDSCEGTGGLIHGKWFKGVDEDCICCDIVREAAARKALQQRKRDEKEAEKLRKNASRKRKTVRKNVRKRR
jgi:hypothetical protein